MICIAEKTFLQNNPKRTARFPSYKEPFSMDMQLYTLHVVPTVLLFYGVFVLFMHPPFKVIGATLLGGLVMAILNMVADKIAITLGIWHYSASGLVAQLPLP